MARLDGRVAIVTGSGRGLGRSHALFLAREGASVVVNDLGGDVHGEGSDLTPAQQVVAEIQSAGGRAAVSGHDVADWDQARDLVKLAVETFGDLHILVNNAGILRDRSLANMSESEWDAVIRVHLTGHAAPTRHAVTWWRQRSKDGHDVRASVIMTSSIAGFAGNFGQANYSSAKAAVLALSQVVALEGEKYGVRSNVVSPSARTRITALWSEAATMEEPAADGFDLHDPANVSPLIGWLSERDCTATAQVFHVSGGAVFVLQMPSVVHQLRLGRRWRLEDCDREIPSHLVKPFTVDDFEKLAAGSGAIG